MTTWPPPTQNMTADELAKLLQIARSLIEHLAVELPVACAKEGHVWDNPVGLPHTKCEGGEFVPADPDVLMAHAHWVGGKWVTWYKRTCTRCGFVEDKKGVPQPAITPFVEQTC